VCLVLPLLIPRLIRTEDKNKEKPTDNDKSKEDAWMQTFYYFYTAPIVKFFCHSVTSGNFR